MYTNRQNCVVNCDIFFTRSWVNPGILWGVFNEVSFLIQALIEGLSVFWSNFCFQVNFDIVVFVGIDEALKDIDLWRFKGRSDSGHVTVNRVEGDVHVVPNFEF